MTADTNLWDDPAILAEIGRQVFALVEKIKEMGEKENGTDFRVNRPEA